MESPFNTQNNYDKFENGVLTTTGCFSRHSLSRNEQGLEWLARQNETKLRTSDINDTVCAIIERLSGLEKSVDESFNDYYDRVMTHLM